MNYCKTISLISPSGHIIIPHFNYSDTESLKRCISHCTKFKTILRHFDVEEITKFLLFIQIDIPADKQIDKYFENIKDIIIILNYIILNVLQY